jgi:hypothetical protein
MDIWSILQPFGTFYGNLVYYSRFGMLYHEKSGKPGFYKSFSADIPMYVYCAA